jgi:hypothetical protein
MSFFGRKLLFGASTSSESLGFSSSNPKTANSTISNIETIDCLCDRINSSTLIEDRRDSLRQIKHLSTKFKLDVGTQAMHVLIDTLKSNK